MDGRLVAPLKYLHKYRNEAYHHAQVRTETIRTAAILLLEVNTELLTSLSALRTSLGSWEDYSWLEERFDVDANDLFMGKDTKLAEVLKDIKKELLPSDKEIEEALQQHLQSRIEDLVDSLDFISSNANVASREEALRLAQYKAPRSAKSVEAMIADFAEFEAPYSMDSIESLESRVQSISAEPGALEAFSVFSELESLLESIEEPVIEAVIAIDNEIQFEIDRARGK